MIVIIIVNDDVYGIISWYCHCESSPSSSDEYSTGAGLPLTFGSLDQAG